MIVWPLLFFELFFIFITSRYIFQAFFSLFYKLSKSQKFSFSALSFIFFPGTFLHEFSHLLSAEVLRVPVHGIEFVPEYRNGNLKMGSVKIQKTDAVRSLLIGAAPFFTGVGVLTIFLWLIYSYVKVSDVFSSFLSFGAAVICIYLLFVITNTMFSSKKDMDGIYIFIILIVSIIFVSYMLGLHPDRILLTVLANAFLEAQGWRMVSFMSVPLFVNLLVVIISIVFAKKSI